MMKLLTLLLLAALAFAATLAGVLAATGNLNAEAIHRLVKGKPAVAPAAPVSDDVDPIARALKDRDEQLKQREASLVKEEERLKVSQQDLDQLRSQLQETLKQIVGQVSATEQGQTEALQGLAKTLSQMKPQNAAQAIEKFSPDEAANVLRMMKDKDSGKILDNIIDPDRRGLILRALAQAKPEQPVGDTTPTTRQ